MKRAAFAEVQKRTYTMWKKVAETVLAASGTRVPRTSLDLVNVIQRGMPLINPDQVREMSGCNTLATLYDKTRNWLRRHCEHSAGSEQDEED